MFSKSLSAATVVLSALSLVQAQTFTSCDPTKKTCPADPGLGTSVTTTFGDSESDAWHALEGTTMDYSGGANFVIKKNTDAPTMQFNKYIFFGKVEVVMKASAGAGIVSSFILESDDLDEIDWEWLGTKPKEVQSNFFGKGDVTTYDRGATHQLTDNILDKYLKYTIDWTDKSIQWKIGPEDGDEASQVTVRQLFATDPLAKAGTRYPQTPMKVKMGSWIACLDANDVAKKGTCDWAGGEYDGKGPYTMNVKSVTVTDYGCSGEDGEYTYSDLTGSWQSIKPAGYCAGPYKNSSPSEDSSDSDSTTTATSSTTSGGVFVESTTSTSSTATSTSSSKDATVTKTSTSGTSTVVTPTTLSTTSSGASQTTSGTSATSTPTDLPSSANKKKMGAMEYSVVALGLGLGYLVM